MRGELSVGCWVRVNGEDDCYRVEEELYDSSDFPIYRLSDGRTVQVWEISDWSKDHTPKLSEVRPGDKVRLHGEEKFYEVYKTTYGCGAEGIVIGTGRLELSDGREVSILEVAIHKFIATSEEGENYWTGEDYSEPTPEMLADLRTDDNGREGR
jgi:hypothetical protein